MLHLNLSPFPILQTDRFRLRALETTDDQAIHAIRSDDRVNQFLDRPRPASIADTQAFIQKIRAGVARNECVYWVVTRQEVPQPIGTICYFNLVPEHDRAEIGYELHPDFQGQGIMGEVLPQVLQFGFEVMGLRQILAHCAAGNVRSLRMLEKNHFTRDPSAEQPGPEGEHLQELLVYSLDKALWEVSHGKDEIRNTP